MKPIREYFQRYRFPIGSIEFCVNEMARVAQPVGNQRMNDKLQLCATTRDMLPHPSRRDLGIIFSLIEPTPEISRQS